MKLLFTLFITLFIGFQTNSQLRYQLKTGRWIGCLELNEADTLYFEMELRKEKKQYVFTLLNGEERVPMKQPYLQDDSIHLFFSNFNSELVFEIKHNSFIKGRWINYLKTNYSIPFSAQPDSTSIFPVSAPDAASDFSGKWKTVFSPDNKPYDAIGVFEQKGNRVTGTFLTETGDFRYLSGNVDAESLFLSGFDGSHAYLFKGTKSADEKITGEFISGTHYRTTWNAERDDHFELRNPDSLTLFSGDPYDFSITFNDLEGRPFTFPNETYKNKVVIIQILGSWCANCMDETVYFKELYDSYHAKGLEIITVGYEIGENEQEFTRHLLAYKQRFDLNHKILVGGSARKSSAKEDFNFLSDFTSFPTTMFFDRSGKVVRIHTGFSGPGTGKYYLNYKEKTEQLIEQLINE